VLLKLTAAAESRRIWVALADRCLPAKLSPLGQAIRGDLAVDAAELRSLLAKAPGETLPQ
jgi:hypothetical protein